MLKDSKKCLVKDSTLTGKAKGKARRVAAERVKINLGDYSQFSGKGKIISMQELQRRDKNIWKQGLIRLTNLENIQ